MILCALCLLSQKKKLIHFFRWRQKKKMREKKKISLFFKVRFDTNLHHLIDSIRCSPRNNGVVWITTWSKQSECDWKCRSCVFVFLFRLLFAQFGLQITTSVYTISISFSVAVRWLFNHGQRMTASNTVHTCNWNTSYRSVKNRTKKT